MKITLSLFSFVLMVFNLSLSSAQYSKPLFAAILKEACSVLPLTLNATSPVGAFLTTFILSGFSPTILFRNLIRASYNAFVAGSKATNNRLDLSNYLINMAHLFTTNASVDAHNNSLYILSKADKGQIKAVDIIVRDMFDDLKKLMEIFCH